VSTDGPYSRALDLEIDSELREEGLAPATLLTATLDLDEPVGLLAIAVLHFIDDDDDARRVVRRLLDALPAGSWFATSTATGDFDPAGTTAGVEQAYRARGEILRHRTRAQARCGSRRARRGTCAFHAGPKTIPAAPARRAFATNAAGSVVFSQRPLVSTSSRSRT
jgi:hypothetical protein